MKYRITHTTSYEYAEPVALCHNLVHLTCRATPRQVCHSSQLLISPLPAVTTSRIDAFGNPMTWFTIQEPHHKLTVTALALTEALPVRTPDLSQSPPWEDVRQTLRNDRAAHRLDAYQFAFDSPFVAASADLLAYAMPSFSPGRLFLEAVRELTQRIFTDFRYDSTATTIATPLREVLARRRGVCQDFAHLQIGCLRSLGLAARYVSGYLRTLPPPGRPRLVGADASHAWLSAYCPNLGWVDFDPTNNQVPSDQHITLAWGRDYDDVSPTKGVILGGGRQAVAVAVDVEPVASEPDAPATGKVRTSVAGEPENISPLGERRNVSSPVL